ncbi:hypothetical protein Plhal304r1_c040g0117761 [Plasmopara halstedii]
MAFSDALLDLTSTDEDVKSKVLDFYGKDELIGVGSDDDIIPEDIVWMKKRAAYRSYLMSRTLISFKPDDGFDHQNYGITSEHVTVFADVAL